LNTVQAAIPKYQCVYSFLTMDIRTLERGTVNTEPRFWLFQAVAIYDFYQGRNHVDTDGDGTTMRAARSSM
jgi:hypothetical protein